MAARNASTTMSGSGDSAAIAGASAMMPSRISFSAMPRGEAGLVPAARGGAAWWREVVTIVS
jgi:hypothetical protein